ncbi:3D domain-containing protein [Marivirga sp.]|uniref:3D domain-containing protein n=1 Tax=Marivirga sp. TaxID=2018662 RepID=UPI003DA73A73
MNNFKNLIFIFLLSGLLACNRNGDSEQHSEKIQYDTLKVTATAYNSVESQTKKGNPAIAAWGDTLRPGMNAIAVSRDLIDSGLVYNSEIMIEGMDSIFFVKDKMNKRWTNKIDIYMGLDIEAARNWGKQEIKIYIPKKNEDLDTTNLSFD